MTARAREKGRGTAKRSQLFCRQGRSKPNPMHTIGICRREAKKIDPSAKWRRVPRGPSDVTISASRDEANDSERQGDRQTRRAGATDATCPADNQPPSVFFLSSLSPCRFVSLSL